MDASRYRFTESQDGFRIEHPQRQTTSVRLTHACLLVTSEGQQAKQFALISSARQLTYEVARMLLGPAELPDGSGSIRLMQEAWALAPGVFGQRDRLLAQSNPAVLAVQELVSGLTGQIAPAAQAEVLYRDPHVARDVLTYRAAAVALAHLESEFWGHFCAQRLGRTMDPTPELLLDAMRQWRGLYSPSGVPYRSLNRTLMNLPQNIPPTLMCHLNGVRLERPILDTLELTTLLTHIAHERRGCRPELIASQRRILQHATADQIRSAIRQIAIATRRRLDPRRHEDVAFAIDYLSDHPEPYHGTLDGLVRRTIRWHRQMREQARLDKMAVGLGGRARATAPPPIPLPATPGITFLATVGAVIDEARRMTNCIASYAEAAVAGRCFLFHVDYEGERASIEVSPSGTVRQAAGPGNCDNPAAWWGRQQLGTWAADFPPRRQVAKTVFPPNQAGEAARPPVMAPRRRRRRRHTVLVNQLAFPFYAERAA